MIVITIINLLFYIYCKCERRYYCLDHASNMDEDNIRQRA